jgi:hypothetical protein
MFPMVYWNAAAGMYAYLFSRLSLEGMEVLGESQLMGYPDLPNLRLSPQYPSVSMLDWNSGRGNARYWVLHALIREFQSGDEMVNTVVVGPAPLCAETINLTPLTLTCAGPNAVISRIVFASYGTVVGACGSYSRGTCNAANSSVIVERACVGKHTCTVQADTPTFGDPCYGTVKYLKVQVECSDGGGGVVGSVHAQAFRGVNGEKKLLLINKSSNAAMNVSVAGASGSSLLTIDERTGFGPARQSRLTSDSIDMASFAVSILTFGK